MPFGVSSAPEVFQRRMHEVIEGIEVVADDFVAVGFGEMLEEDTCNHDHHLELFLQRCTERSLKLNDEKLKLRMQEVLFIGHIATTNGLCVDPHKVQAIMECHSLLMLLPFSICLVCFTSPVTKPLRELTQKEVEWA